MANPGKNNKAALLKPVDSDQKFTMYVAGFVLVVFCIAAFVIYQNRFAGRNAANLTYVELKQTIVNDQGVVARMAVTVQVNIGDEDWLKEHERAMNDLFKKEIASMDVDSLRSRDGFNELQAELKRRFNLEFKTDKVQEVMVTDLLLQDQRK
ncbi:MAG: flagellar basal body-associated FliL family protein [Burkholderiaceae bacterium]|nr:MAG: flagellar basal body-associated FliL family protein [Burkholderiaceae bacterium]